MSRHVLGHPDGCPDILMGIDVRTCVWTSVPVYLNIQWVCWCMLIHLDWCLDYCEDIWWVFPSPNKSLEFYVGCTEVHTSIHTFVYPSLCLSVCLYIHLYACWYICTSIGTYVTVQPWRVLCDCYYLPMAPNYILLIRLVHLWQV